jgi:hypothetical protein
MERLSKAISEVMESATRIFVILGALAVAAILLNHYGAAPPAPKFDADQVRALLDHNTATAAEPKRDPWTDENVAMQFALVSAFDEFCGGLPPNAYRLRGYLHTATYKKDIPLAAYKVSEIIRAVGRQQWCQNTSTILDLDRIMAGHYPPN